MKARISHYNHIVKITYKDGRESKSYFCSKRNAENFAKAMKMGCDCNIDIISK